MGMEMTMLMETLWPTMMAVEVEEKEGEGEGVPPGAERVEEGEGVLEELGKLVMDSLG